MQAIFRQYQEEVSTDPADLRMVGAWAMQKGLWAPRPVDIQSRFAADMADALREEYRTDKARRRYRSKLAVSNRQGVFWGDIDTAPRAHVEKNVAQRRRQTTHDLLQLQVDVDHYNDYHPEEKQIELMLDFTDDIAEMKVGAMIEDEEAA
jgi:hypothetical protein